MPLDKITYKFNLTCVMSKIYYKKDVFNKLKKTLLRNNKGRLSKINFYKL